MLKFKHKAFSLIELSISLLIIGIILGSVFKGLQLVEYAKLQSVAKQFQEIRLHIETYISHHGEFPGNKSSYQSIEDTKYAIHHMYQKGVLRSNMFFKSKFGGLFKLKTIQGKHYLQLVSQAEDSLLNIKQIEILKSFFAFEQDTEYVMDQGIFSYPLSE